MNIETLMQQEGVAYEKSVHKPTYTAQGLAGEEHVSGYNVAKPVIVRGHNAFAMCVVPACARLDLEKVSEVLQEADVRLASEDEMAGLFPDCELGAEPPIGRLFGMRTVIDERLHQDEFVVMQAGTHTECLKVQRSEWERLCQPIVADITRA